MLSDPARITLSRLLGHAADSPLTAPGGQEAAPVLRVLRPPLLDDLDDLIERYDDPDGERASPNSWLARQRYGGDSQPVDVASLHARRCCADLLASLQPRLHLLRLPHTEACRCGTIYAVEIKVH